MSRTDAASAGSAAAAERPEGGQTVATVERAVDILALFASVDSFTLGVTEIADRLGMSKAVVHRLLTSLRKRKLIDFHSDTRRYSLGPMAMRLGLAYMARLDIRRLAGPELQRLSRETNETATLSLRTGDTRVYVDQVTPAREVIMSVTIGLPYPLHAGGSSKAFLAFLPEAEVDDYLSRALTAMTPQTVVDPERLRAELAEIRERGWARSFGERQLGAASVAAPVLDHADLPVAVVSVCGPAERFAEEADACAERLLEVTTELSQRMGRAG